MKISFHTKFRDKIHIVDKRGLKYALLSQPGQKQSTYQTKLTHQLDNSMQNNKVNKFKRSYTKTQQSENTIIKNNRQNEILLEQQKDITPQNKYKFDGKKSHSILKHNLSEIEDEDSLFLKYSLVRNPQIQSLAIKLKSKQKQKYQTINSPKFIDQMLLKHQNLIRRLDKKKQSLSTIKQIDRIQNQPSNIKIKQLPLISQENHKKQHKKQYDQTLPQPSSPTYIKLKKIQQIIIQTHLNRQKQKYQSNYQKSNISKSSQCSILYSTNLKNRSINSQKLNPQAKGVSTYQNSLRKYQPSGLDTLDSVYSVNVNSYRDNMASSKKKIPLPKIKKPWISIFSRKVQQY